MPATDEIKAAVPRRHARRMSDLGRLVYWLFRNDPPEPEDAIVYATTFTEARALEAYLESLPHASPLAFQTSIHPGAVQQAMIALGRPVRTLLPLAGEEDLFTRMCLTGLTQQSGRVFLLTGEERGDRLLHHGLASATTWALCLRLGPGSGEGNKRAGTLRWERTSTARENDTATPPPSATEIARAVHRRTPLNLPTPMGGTVYLTWTP